MTLFDKRDVRAAKESMTVVSEGPGLWTVYSGEESEYPVFLDGEWKCYCRDHYHRRKLCKHIRRVQMELGERPVPDLPGRTDVEVMMSANAGRQEVSA